MTLIPNQPYPDKDGWEDISQYLASGWETIAPQSALARVVGNGVEFAVRLLGVRATDFTMFKNLPGSMRPIMNFGFIAPTTEGAMEVLFNTAGIGHMTIPSLERIGSTRYGPYPAQVQFYGVLPRAGAQ